MSAKGLAREDRSKAIFAGSAGNAHYFYFYVTAVCGISLLTALVMPDTRKTAALADLEV